MDTTHFQNQLKSRVSNKELLNEARQYAFDYLDKIDKQRVVPDQNSEKILDHFDEPLPLQGMHDLDVLRQLHKYGSSTTVAQTGGRYFGFVNGGTLPIALAARWLADAWDQNFALYVMSPIASKLESVCESWLKSIFRLPDETVAGFVTGTSTGTLCGLAAARYHLLKEMDWDVNQKGLTSAPRLRIVAGDAHASVFKALAILGLGQESIELVPVDDQGRMLSDKLPILDSSTILILQAGNVNSGAFDFFQPLCQAAQDAGAWTHIDGAFGLWAAASEEKSLLTEGIELADSWSVDAHKTLNAPYDNGIVLCRHRDSLVSAMQATGSYIQYSEKRDGMLYTLDMSRRARSIELWAALKFLGKSGVGTLVDLLCARANLFAELLRKESFQILNDVVFNQVLVSGDTPEETQAVLKGIQSSGECWCGGATWQGKPVIRISVCSWATTKEDVKQSVEVFVQSRAQFYKK